MSPTPDAPRLRPMQSSDRVLITLHEDGSTTEDTVHVIHAPGAEPPVTWTATVQARPAGWGRP